LTDPVGNTTSYEYDSQKHVVKETNALDKSRYFEYLGQWLIRKTDRNDRVTEYVYDRFGRQKEERWLDGKKVIKTIVNTYNEIGDLIEVKDDLNSFNYKYNALKLETKSNAKFNGLNKEIVLKSEYDRRGQRTLSESEEFSTQYFYTPNKLVESIIQGDQSVQYSYNAAGQKISAKTPVITSTYNYDGMGRLTKIDHQSVTHYDYQWDAANRIVSMNDGKYNYDKTSQLISANYTKLPSEKYNYDLNGNRSNYQTGKNNQLLHDGENTYEYDSEGNRISKGTTKYFWDHRNRLIKVETPQEMVEYVYDYKNRLVKRSTSKSSEYFVHDGWQIVLTLDKTGSVTNKFLWGAKQDELIAQNSAYALCDHLGTVRDLIGNGIAAHFEYNAFGQLLSKTGNTDCLFKYTGKMTDDVTGLQWNINRWYDAKVGRWISEDSIGFGGRDENLVRYVRNFCSIRTDSSGLLDDSNFIVQYVQIKATDQITIDKTGNNNNETFSINLIIQGNVPNSTVGLTFASPLYINYEKDTISISGKCYHQLSFRIAGVAFAIVLPTDAVNLPHWIAYIEHFRNHNNPPVLAFNFSSPPTNAEIIAFQTGVIKHENNHVNPFEQARSVINIGLAGTEELLFEVIDGESAAASAANTAIAQANQIWTGAQNHSDSMHHAAKEVPSFFTYPLLPLYSPVWNW
jgi:RHS repeat-associated protein